MLAPKFIVVELENQCYIFLDFVIAHKDLLKEGMVSFGGGYWELKETRDSWTLILSGQSVDFGWPSVDRMQQAVVNNNVFLGSKRLHFKIIFTGMHSNFTFHKNLEFNMRQIKVENKQYSGHLSPNSSQNEYSFKYKGITDNTFYKPVLKIQIEDNNAMIIKYNVNISFIDTEDLLQKLILATHETHKIY